MQAANSSETDRTVVLPKGAVVSILPVFFNYVKNVTLRIDGTLLVSKNFKAFPPRSMNDDQNIGVIQWERSEDILVEGKGTFDGQGYMWWIREIFVQNNHGRPFMMRFVKSRNIEMRDLYFHNSPYYHIVYKDCENLYSHDFEIYVDIVGQLELHRLFGGTYHKEVEHVNGFKLELPIFPLNTDGIDIWAKNATFRRIKVTNFDDSIVPKPCNQAHEICKCTTDILIEDCETLYTCGMSVGSIPPNVNHACIKDVTFRNIKMVKPMKGVYIKPNPGDVGTGLVQNITYENMVMEEPIWWSIWIGPQQQHQPGGKL